MRNSRWLYTLLALLATGLIGAGCGDDDDGAGGGETTPSVEEGGVTDDAGVTGEGAVTEEDGATVDVGDGATADSVVEECEKALEGLGYSEFPCQQMRTTFEACQEAGDQDCEAVVEGAIENLIRAGGP